MLSVHAVRYLRERWVTPDGQTIVAPLPDGTQGHFGPNLRRFVLMQYHQGQTTLPRLATLLQSVGLSISEREIQRLLTEKQESFLDETRNVLRTGLRPGLHACHNTVTIQITFLKFLHAHFIYFIERTHGPHVNFYMAMFLVNQLTFFRQ